MSTLHRVCKIFDPINITISGVADNFIIDTWHSLGLMQKSLLAQLEGVTPSGKTKVMLSSGMYVECPLVKVGVQIGNIRALPVEFAIVDDGSAPLLFGSDFLEKLFDMQAKSIGSSSSTNGSSTQVSIEPPEKYDPDSLGLRLIPESKTVDALQLEKFLNSIRIIHNIGLLANSQLHQHNDWQGDNSSNKINAVNNTINNDYSLYENNTLQISWVETGSIWLSMKSGSKSALSWLSQIFEKTTDARLRATLAEAASAEEEAAIKQLTRSDIANAKSWEQRRTTAQNIRETREEWQSTVLGEIDFREKLFEKIKDQTVRDVAQSHLDKALNDLVSSDFMPIIENMPKINDEDKDSLPTKNDCKPQDHPFDKPKG